MAYYTPTPEAVQTAAYGRSLMGQARMNFYMPDIPRDLNGLGALRFNRAVARGMYQMPFVETPPAGQLGQLQADPTMLFAGVGILGLGLFLLGRKHPRRSRRGRR